MKSRPLGAHGETTTAFAAVVVVSLVATVWLWRPHDESAGSGTIQRPGTSENANLIESAPGLAASAATLGTQSTIQASPGTIASSNAQQQPSEASPSTTTRRATAAQKAPKTEAAGTVNLAAPTKDKVNEHALETPSTPAPQSSAPAVSSNSTAAADTAPRAAHSGNAVSQTLASPEQAISARPPSTATSDTTVRQAGAAKTTTVQSAVETPKPPAGAMTTPPTPHPFMVSQAEDSILETATGTTGSPVVSASDGVPPGFEDLMREQETLVDVYFAGQYRLSTQAKYTPNTLTFIDPGAVVERLPGITQPRKVEGALSGELPANQELRCYYRGQTNCGVLEPEIAAVIFDSDRFRADVFVNPDYLVVQEAAVPKFLPPSSAGTSFLQNFSYAFSGDDSDITAESNLYSLSELGWKENAVLMQANYSNREFLDIDTLVGQRDFQGRRYQLGWFLTDSQSLRFSPETDILGFRFGTSLDTRADLRQSTGRQIEVFLQSRGEVSIFKDGRLLSSRIYDAGNQVLDTSALPGGAYEIQIRIRDAGGERIENQFYVKNQRLPPKDMPLYFFELGEITRPDSDQALPKNVDEYLARGGFNLRLDSGNAIFGGLSTTGDDSSAEFGWIGLGRGYDLALSGALARDGRYGLYTEFRVGWRDIYLSAFYRRIWGNDGFDPGEFPLLGVDQEQASAQLTIPAGRGRVSISGRYNDLSEPDPLETGTIAYELPIRLPGRSNLAFRTSFTYDSGDQFAFAGIRWSLADGHWSYSASPELAQERTDGSTDNYWRGNASANWDSRDMWSSELRGGVTATHDRDFSTVGANVNWGGRYGRARLQTERVFNEDTGDSTRHTGSLATSIVATKGAATFGGREQNRAAIIIDVGGDRDAEAFFEILVDGTIRGTVRPGSRALLTLTPFENYHVRLRLKGKEFVYFDDREREVTLYPGNVVTLAWKAQTVNIVFGRIVDIEGNPVGNALLKGVAGLATTDDLGLFQAEINPETRSLVVETRESTCEVEMPEYQTRQGVGSVGTLHCALRPKIAASSAKEAR